MPRYFKKLILSNRVVINGQEIKWEHIGGNAGVRMFDDKLDAPIVKELDSYADNRKMGIVRINGDIYAELKKKATERPSPRPSSGLAPIRVVERDLMPKRSDPSKPDAAHAATKPPAPSPAPTVAPAAKTSEASAPATPPKVRTAKRSAVEVEPKRQDQPL